MKINEYSVQSAEYLQRV